jgi:hypothetical protein
MTLDLTVHLPNAGICAGVVGSLRVPILFVSHNNAR